MTKNGYNEIIEENGIKKKPNLEFIAYTLGPDSGPYSDSNIDNYPQRILDAYLRTFSACEKRSPHFENYDAILVMDREGRIPYYGMHSYCKKKGQPIPDENQVFFIKTTGISFLYENALEKAVSRSNSKLVKSAYEQSLSKVTDKSIWFQYDGKNITRTELKGLCPDEDPELFDHIILNENLEWEKTALGGESSVWNSEILAAEFTRALKLPRRERYKISEKSRGRGCGVSHRVEQIEEKLLPEVSDYYSQAMNLIKNAPAGTQFHNKLEEIAMKKYPKVLLVDASSCDGRQKASTTQFLREVYGNHLDVDCYTVTQVLYGSRCEDPLIIMRNFLELIPSNMLNIDGFKISYRENERDIREEGFMKNDQIGRELQDNFVEGIKSIGNHLAEDYTTNKFNGSKEREESKKKFREYLISNQDLVSALKEVDKVAKDFEK